jgi:hypothetical protein
MRWDGALCNVETITVYMKLAYAVQCSVLAPRAGGATKPVAPLPSKQHVCTVKQKLGDPAWPLCSAGYGTSDE